MSSHTTSNGNFANLLVNAARQFGDTPAIVARTGTTSFDDLARRSSAIAQLLVESGVGQGATCAILLNDPTDAAATFFASLGIGAIGINVNELYRPRQIEYVLNHSRAKVLLTSDTVLQQLPRRLAAETRIVFVDAARVTADRLEVRGAADNGPAQVTYTSASTGQPKGVVTSHRALWAGVRIVADYLGLRRDDRIAGLLPFSFVYGFNQLTTALYTGATLVVERSVLAAEIVATLRRERVTVVAGVPPLWRQLLGVPDFRNTPLPDLRVMTCAGGRLSPASVQELRRAQPQARLFLMYGLTEVFRSAYLDPSEVDAHPDSMGRAIPESVVYVVGDNGRIAEDGEIGELVHGGPTVAIGYLHDPDATQRTFRPNPFLEAGSLEPRTVVFSGDLVRRDAEGRLYYVSRRDHLIKTLGYRVSPDEINDVLHASGEVQDAAVVTEPDSLRGESILACVVLRDDGSLDRLTRFAKVELPRHMQPARFLVLDTIPRNASGKHDIPALKEQVLQS